MKLLSGGRHIIAPDIISQRHDISVISTRKEDAPTLKVSTPGGGIHLHSSYDPVEEARRWAENALKNRAASRAVVFGFGLGYHIEALLALKQEMKTLTAVEVNPEVFTAALAARPLDRILGDPRVHIIAGRFASVAANIRSAVDSSYSEGGADLFVHRPSMEVLPDDASGLREILEYILLSSADNPVFPRLKKENTEKNIRAFDAAPGVVSLSGSLKGKPAIVAAAGPSLDLSINILKSSGARITLIAVDSALAPFHSAGIRPGFVVSGDPQPEAARMFDGLDPTDEKLVFFPSSCPAVVNFFPPDRRYAAVSSADQAATDPPGLHKGELHFSGTVFLAALDFAVKTGADPIAVIGADFSFLEDRTHATGSRTQGYSPRYGRLREVPDQYGKPVTTSDILFMYLRDFERYCLQRKGNTRVINCTARGAAVHGVPHASFESFLRNFVNC